jgi:lactate dehydrogenase-like 2-hydroxyacid dehydrogenase
LSQRNNNNNPCFLVFFASPSTFFLAAAMTHPLSHLRPETISLRLSYYVTAAFGSFQLFNGRTHKAIQPIQTQPFPHSNLTHADSLPNLEIDSTYSVGLDKIDLRKCKEK